jgi:hypothetical protein
MVGRLSITSCNQSSNGCIAQKEKTMFNLFKSKQKREAESLAKLQEGREARRKRADYYRNNSSVNTIDTTTMSAAYCMSQYEPAASTQRDDNTLSQGSGSFSGAGASSSWDDSISRSCSSSGDSYSSSDSNSSSSSSSDSSSSCSSSD